MALAGALAITVHTVTGFTNRSLRAARGRTARRAVLDEPGQLRPAPAATQRPDPRLPHSNTYILTPDGQRFAIFYTKIHNRVLVPLTAANDPPAPLPLRQALKTIDTAVTDYLTAARLPPAA